MDATLQHCNFEKPHSSYLLKVHIVVVGPVRSVADTVNAYCITTMQIAEIAFAACFIHRCAHDHKGNAPVTEPVAYVSCDIFHVQVITAVYGGYRLIYFVHSIPRVKVATTETSDDPLVNASVSIMPNSVNDLTDTSTLSSVRRVIVLGFKPVTHILRFEPVSLC